MIELLAAAALAAPCRLPQGAEVRRRTREVEYDAIAAGGKVREAAVTSQAAGEEPVVHDDAADVDPRSLRVEGDELVWTRGGARRSVPFP